MFSIIVCVVLAIVVVLWAWSLVYLARVENSKRKPIAEMTDREFNIFVKRIKKHTKSILGDKNANRK